MTVSRELPEKETRTRNEDKDRDINGKERNEEKKKEMKGCQSYGEQGKGEEERRRKGMRLQKGSEKTEGKEEDGDLGRY